MSKRQRSWITQKPQRLLPLAALIFGLVLWLGRPALAADGGAATDRVLFVNGDRVSGSLTSATNQTVVYSGSVTGTIHLNWTDIQEFTVHGKKLVLIDAQHPDGVPLNEAVIEVNGNGLQVTTPAGNPVTVKLQDLVSIGPQSPPSKGHFKAVGGTLKVSPDSIVRATQDQIALAGAFDIGLTTNSEEAFSHQDTIVGIEANYSDSRKLKAAAVISELYSGIFQQNFYLRRVNPSAKFSRNGPYLYGLANYYHNLSLGMNLSQSYGGGIGLKGGTDSSTLSFAADIRYLREELYTPGKSFSAAQTGLMEEYVYSIPGTAITLHERVNFLPVINHANAYLVRGSAGLDVPINSSFSFDIDVLDDYLENAPPKNLRNYVKYTVGLKYTFPAPPKPQ